MDRAARREKVEYLVDTPPFPVLARTPKGPGYGRTGYTTKHRILANTVSFGLKFKASVATAKLATSATAKYSRKHSRRRSLLLCLWFGIDLRSRCYVDAYSTGLWRKACATAIAKNQQELVGNSLGVNYC